jgi:hypothetical protein
MYTFFFVKSISSPSLLHQVAGMTVTKMVDAVVVSRQGMVNEHTTVDLVQDVGRKLRRVVGEDTTGDQNKLMPRRPRGV